MKWRTQEVELGNNFKIVDNGNILDLRTNQHWFEEDDDTYIITHSLGYGLLVIETEHWSKLFDVNKSGVLYYIEGIEYSMLRYTYFHKIGVLQLTDFGFFEPELSFSEYLRKNNNTTWFINVNTGNRINFSNNDYFSLSAYPNPDVYPEVLNYYKDEQLDDYYYTYFYNDKKYYLSKESVKEDEKCLEYISNTKDGKKLIARVYNDCAEVLIS